VGLPLAVCVGLNDPQALAGVHDQFTPFESLVTIAVMSLVELTGTELGGAGLKVTVMVPLVMVIVAKADLVESVTDVAVIVTLLPLGIAEGAV
jgi:hypothetical protein